MRLQALDDEVAVLEHMKLMRRLLFEVAKEFPGGFFSKSYYLHLGELFKDDWAFVTCRRYGPEVERLAGQLNDQEFRTKPTRNLLEEAFGVCSAALPETINFGLSITAEKMERKHFYQQPGLRQEAVLKRLAEEWLKPDPRMLLAWTQAWTHKHREGILSNSLEEYQTQIIEGEQGGRQ